MAGKYERGESEQRTRTLGTLLVSLNVEGGLKLQWEGQKLTC
jgi:hypothetical protein